MTHMFSCTGCWSIRFRFLNPRLCSSSSNMNPQKPCLLSIKTLHSIRHGVGESSLDISLDTLKSSLFEETLKYIGKICCLAITTMIYDSMFAGWTIPISSAISCCCHSSPLFLSTKRYSYASRGQVFIFLAWHWGTRNVVASFSFIC